MVFFYQLMIIISTSSSLVIAFAFYSVAWLKKTLIFSAIAFDALIILILETNNFCVHCVEEPLEDTLSRNY